MCERTLKYDNQCNNFSFIFIFIVIFFYRREKFCIPVIVISCIKEIEKRGTLISLFIDGILDHSSTLVLK